MHHYHTLGIPRPTPPVHAALLHGWVGTVYCARAWGCITNS